MKTLINPRTLLSNIIKTKKEKSSNYLFPNKNNLNSSYKVGVFSHYRDAKVALEELEEAGFPLGRITLIARDCWRYRWLPDLIIGDRFEDESFGSNQIARHFFQRLFKQGKYLLLVTGKENDVNSACVIMGRRKGHSEVWYF